MAIYNNQVTARTAARNAASQLAPALTDGNIAFSSANCPVGTQMTITITYPLTTMTGIAGPFTLTGTGTMLCGG
jgi:hypothetical protein